MLSLSILFFYFMTAEQVLDQFAQQLTYGLVPDIDTLLSGGVMLVVITAGSRILYEIFDTLFLAEKRSLRQRDSLFGEAQLFYELRNSSDKGSFNYEYYNSLYHFKMNETVKSSLKTGSVLGDDIFSVKSSDSPKSLFLEGGFDTKFDALRSEGNSLEEVFPELVDSSSPPSHLDNVPPPEYYGPPPEDEYYGPY